MENESEREKEHESALEQLLFNEEHSSGSATPLEIGENMRLIRRVVLHNNAETVNKLKERNARQQKQAEMEKAQREKDWKERRDANRKRPMKKSTLEINGVPMDYSNHIEQDHLDHNGFVDDSINITVEELLGNMLNNLVDLPDSRTDPSGFDKEFFERYVDKTPIQVSHLGKNGKKLFPFFVIFKWRL